MIIKNIKMLAAVLLAAVLSAMLFAGCSVKNNKKADETTETTESLTVRVMFPEGSTAVQIAQLLEKNGVCPAEDFLAAANDREIAAKYGFDIPDPENRSFLLEGYLFPDTYDFYRGESAETAIGRFLKNTASKYDGEFIARCGEKGFTLDEILSLASVIQEEAGDPAEMGKVSSVLNNRLESKRFPKLQCDVTVFYLNEYVKPYVSEERFEELKELYNTYICSGLPEGPITNSGIDAVYAALDPDETDWFFFVTDADGVYHYAETWEEHVANCREAGI